MNYKITILSLIMLFLMGCQGYFSDMDINSSTQPDIADAMADIAQYPSLISGSFNRYWYTTLSHDNGGSMASANADATVSAWGNWGAPSYIYNYKNYENAQFKPEIGNTDQNGGSLAGYWANCYSIINNMRDILYVINSKKLQWMEGGADKTHILKANAYFLLGATYTELALLFDKAFVIDEMNRENVTIEYMIPYSDVQKAALTYLDKSIALCKENSFDNISVLPGTLADDNTKLERLARFVAARVIAYLPRTKDETVDWSLVSSYLKGGKGLDEDFKILMPEQGWEITSTAVGSWTGSSSDENVSDAQQYARIAPRIIQMMADQETSAYRETLWPLRSSFFASNPDNSYSRIKSSDFRLNGKNNDNEGADFKFMTSYTASGSSVQYNSYMSYSPYGFQRGTEAATPGGAGNVYCWMKAESDLLEAEAILKTEGPNTMVASLINRTRTNRGNLKDISATSSLQEMKYAIFYEKMVECLFAYPFTSLFERRKTDLPKEGLTPYSFRQFPVPMKELKQWNIESYTFGGKIGVDALENLNKYDFVPTVKE